MVNHVRTLLLNVSGSSGLPGYSYFGEEYVDNSYISIELPSYLTAIRSIIFGSSPDRACLNYRVNQFMTMVHGTDLASYATKYDSRITYWPLESQIDTLLTGSPTITKLGTTTQNLRLSGDYTNRMDPDKLYHQFIVDVTDGSNVTVTRTSPYRKIVVSSYTITDSYSQQIALADYLAISFSFPSGVGQSWVVEVYHKPTESLDSIVTQLETYRSTEVTQLFGDEEGDYTSWKTIWHDKNQPTPHRLGSLVLALAERTHEVVFGE